MSKLPDTLHELIDLAEADIYTGLSLPEKFELNMSTWLDITEEGKYRVCLAGVVMVSNLTDEVISLVSKKNRYIYPHQFGEENRKKLLALEWVAEGNMNRAFQEFYPEESLLCVNFPRYLMSLFDEHEITKEALDMFFKNPAMLEARAKLKELNL